MAGSSPPLSGNPRLWNALTNAHVALYRASRGRLGAKLKGVDVLLLDHVGRKSGRRRTHPLLYLRDGDDVVIVASKGGSPTDPAWWLNLKANPVTQVQIGGERIDVRARQASPEEKARLWPRAVDAWPDYAAYQERTEREIPLAILSAV